MRRALAMVVALAVLLVSKEAELSGAHWMHFLERDFIYEHEELSRKIFHDAESSNEFHDGKRQHSTRVFLASLPTLERFIAQARQRGIRLEPLALRAVDEQRATTTPDSAEQLRAWSQQSPHRQVRLSLDRGPHEEYSDHLVVQLARALDEAQARWFWEQLPALRFAALEQNQQAIAGVDEAALRAFLPGFSTLRAGSRLALWVGSTEQIRPVNEAHFRAQAEALADELLPQLEAALADPGLSKQLVSGKRERLISLREKLGRTPTRGDLPRFNPYGPLLDDFGMRSSAEAGILRVRVLFVERDRWGARPGGPQIEQAFERYLARLVMPAAARTAEIDTLLRKIAASPEERSEQLDPLMRLLKDPALRSLGGQHGIDALVRWALSTGPDRDGMRRTAIENLRWLDVPERDQVYFSLLASHRDEGVMSVISQSFAERPSEARVEALLSVWRDPRSSEDSRMWSKNGLQTARNHCTSAEQAPLKAKIDQALGSAD